MSAVYKREMQAYFTSPIAYVFLTVYLFVSGVILYFFNFNILSGDLNIYFTVMIFLLTVFIPLLTMKLLSEERKTKTEQALLCAPISLVGMIFAKFLAAFTLLVLAMSVSTVGLVPLYLYGAPNTAAIISNFIGLMFIGAAFIALGLFISSLTENQLVAAIITVVVIFVSLVLGLISAGIENTALRLVVKWISIFDRYNDFTFGIFNVVSILYYLSICVIFIFLTVRIYEKRRWE